MMGTDIRAARAIFIVPMVVLLSGCMGMQTGGDGAVSRFLQSGGRIGAGDGADTAGSAMQQREAASPVIAELQQRQSVIPAGSPYERVASAVMSTSARTAELDLRAARLRAEAASRNWLPSFGPRLSLSSLGDFAASLLIEQVIFDNGRKRAERDYAAHGVELAAVALSEDSNDRIHDALSLYLDAEEAREKIAIADRSLRDMRHFEWVMAERVEGGISDRSDLDIVRQKLAEISADRQAAAGTRDAALAELAAMAGGPVTDVAGIAPLEFRAVATRPLSVLRAEVERDRTVAQSTIQRASHLPGLSVTGTVEEGGSEAQLGTTGLFGFGTGAQLKAIEASKEAAGRTLAQEMERATRDLVSLQKREASLAQQAATADRVARTAKRNLDLFQTQYKDGARQVMDVVGVYEAWSTRTQRALQIKYDLARVRLDIARDLGVLADGQAI